MIDELEYSLNSSGYCEPLVNIEVHLPVLSNASGGHISPSGKALPGIQPSSSNRQTLPVSNLYVGVRMVDEQGTQVFQIITMPSRNVWDIKTKLDRQTTPPVCPGVPPFIILPLIEP
jgi:hypothetical protein